MTICGITASKFAIILKQTKLINKVNAKSGLASEAQLLAVT
jgi:hypothetical protein